MVVCIEDTPPFMYQRLSDTEKVGFPFSSPEMRHMTLRANDDDSDKCFRGFRQVYLDYRSIMGKIT